MSCVLSSSTNFTVGNFSAKPDRSDRCCPPICTVAPAMTHFIQPRGRAYIRSRVLVNGQKSKFFSIEQEVAGEMYCHLHCMPSLRMHCCRNCMQSTAWKAPSRGGSLPCCMLMIWLAFHSQQMACRAITTGPSFSMHADTVTGQLSPRVESWTLVLLLLCRACPPGPTNGGKRRSP